jgi:hypothetical protein
MAAGERVSRSKRIGTEWEVRVRDYLRQNGFPQAERLPSEGSADRGDISGCPFVVECKRTTREQLAEAMKEAAKEAKNAGKAGYAVVRPSRGRNVSEAFTTIPLWLFACLMRADIPPGDGLQEFKDSLKVCPYCCGLVEPADVVWHLRGCEDRAEAVQRLQDLSAALLDEVADKDDQIADLTHQVAELEDALVVKDQLNHRLLADAIYRETT